MLQKLFFNDTFPMVLNVKVHVHCSWYCRENSR